MKAISRIAILTTLFIICTATIIAADDKKECYYLDKKKVLNKLVPVVLLNTIVTDNKNSIRLDKNGLFQGDKRLCKWSLNGGSGTKEQFSLDGNFAIPILDPACKNPFSQKYTGVGFGDWYLILCGMTSGEILYVSYGEIEYYVPVKSLIQWTRFAPGKFPIKGDSGY